MTTPRRAAIYARISQDRDGGQLGVSRQLADCRARAADLGWVVTEEYVDDDVSAYSGKQRPGYRRMIGDLANGHIDGIMAWHLDRIYRQPIELEELISVCDRVGVSQLETISGSVNLATGDGILVARVMVTVAAGESDAKSRRGKRKMQELAEAGKPHGGGTRPFGFAEDRITHKPREAEVIRELTARALAGESLPSLGRWMDENEIRTVTGKPWRSPTIRQLLLNRRMCGLREHKGTAIGPAVWEPIISVEDSDALRRLLTAPERRTNRTARSYLLSGLCRCGKCGNKLVSSRRYETRRYLCRSGLDGGGGCGRITITAGPVEEIVTEAVLIRLDSPELHDALAGRIQDDGEAVALHEQIEADGAQLSELAGMWARKELSGDEWRAAKAIIEQRQATARRDLSRLSGTRDLDSYRGQGEVLRAQWAGMNLDRQRAVVKTIVDYVEILPGVMGARSVAIERVRPRWRF